MTTPDSDVLEHPGFRPRRDRWNVMVTSDGGPWLHWLLSVALAGCHESALEPAVLARREARRNRPDRKMTPDTAAVCPRCGTVDDPETPFMRHLCSGMRPVTEDERQRIEFSPETKAKLLARLDEFDRCRARAAVEARSAFIG